MPKQITGVLVSDNGDGSVNVQIGAFGYTLALTDLFDRSIDVNQTKQNIRLSFQIGNYAQPDSAEFLVGVNRTNRGMETKAGNVSILGVSLVDATSQTYHLEFIFKNGVYKGQQFGFDMSLNELKEDVSDQTVILNNIVTFLRAGGFTTLTAAAVAQISSAAFWY